MIVLFKASGHGLAEDMNSGWPFKKSSASFSIRLPFLRRSPSDSAASTFGGGVLDVCAEHSSYEMFRNSFVCWNAEACVQKYPLGLCVLIILRNWRCSLPLATWDYAIQPDSHIAPSPIAIVRSRSRQSRDKVKLRLASPLPLTPESARSGSALRTHARRWHGPVAMALRPTSRCFQIRLRSRRANRH
jgi:hypothetical protein